MDEIYARLREMEMSLSAAVAKIEEMEKKSEDQTEMIRKIQHDVEDLKIGYSKVWMLCMVVGWIAGIFTPILLTHMWE